MWCKLVSHTHDIFKNMFLIPKWLTQMLFGQTWSNFCPNMAILKHIKRYLKMSRIEYTHYLTFYGCKNFIKKRSSNCNVEHHYIMAQVLTLLKKRNFLSSLLSESAVSHLLWTHVYSFITKLSCICSVEHQYIIAQGLTRLNSAITCHCCCRNQLFCSCDKVVKHTQ